MRRGAWTRQQCPWKTPSCPLLRREKQNQDKNPMNLGIKRSVAGKKAEVKCMPKRSKTKAILKLRKVFKVKTETETAWNIQKSGKNTFRNK